MRRPDVRMREQRRQPILAAVAGARVGVAQGGAASVVGRCSTVARDASSRVAASRGPGGRLAVERGARAGGPAAFVDERDAGTGPASR